MDKKADGVGGAVVAAQGSDSETVGAEHLCDPCGEVAAKSPPRRARRSRGKIDQAVYLDHIGACAVCRERRVLRADGVCASCGASAGYSVTGQPRPHTLTGVGCESVQASVTGAVPVVECGGDTEPAGCAGGAGVDGGLLRWQASVEMTVEVWIDVDGGRWVRGQIESVRDDGAEVRSGAFTGVKFCPWGSWYMRAVSRVCPGTVAGECGAILSTAAPEGAKCSVCSRYDGEHPLRCDGCQSGQSVTGRLCANCRGRRRAVVEAAGSTKQIVAPPAAGGVEGKIWDRLWECLARCSDLDPRTVAQCKALRDLERKAL